MARSTHDELEPRHHRVLRPAPPRHSEIGGRVPVERPQPPHPLRPQTLGATTGSGQELLELVPARAALCDKAFEIQRPEPSRVQFRERITR
jgi:hypothetical protein